MSLTQPIDHPPYYLSDAGDVEVIDVIEDWGLGFSMGNALKYVARAGKKDASPAAELRDLEKAHWYVERHIAWLSKTLLRIPRGQILRGEVSREYIPPLVCRALNLQPGRADIVTQIGMASRAQMEAEDPMSLVVLFYREVARLITVEIARYGAELNADGVLEGRA
jgi:hypothetical protein